MVTNPLTVLWTGRCTIYEYQDITDPETYQTTQKEVPVLVDEPCRLSYNHEQATNIQSGAAVVSQSITLFIRPDLTIKAGSVIEITQNNVTERYKGSGKPAVYSNHQQIILQLYEDNV
jgi:O-acetylhomoserine/O-acetylserine sulfhydrylase-like pyridoxal-dependent enzyme